MENPIKDVMLSLTLLDIFFISATIVSLFFNLYQFMLGRREKKALQAPLTNALIGLFNDIKSKNLTIYVTQQSLFNTMNPHTQIETLRWEYYNFTQSVIGYLNGFQEALGGALVTLNPKDKEGNLAFRASDYGLTEDEKEFRKQSTHQWRAQQSRAGSPREETDIKHVESESVGENNITTSPQTRDALSQPIKKETL